MGTFSPKIDVQFREGSKPNLSWSKLHVFDKFSAEYWKLWDSFFRKLFQFSLKWGKIIWTHYCTCFYTTNLIFSNYLIFKLGTGTYTLPGLFEQVARNFVRFILCFLLPKKTYLKDKKTIYSSTRRRVFFKFFWKFRIFEKSHKKCIMIRKCVKVVWRYQAPRMNYWATKCNLPFSLVDHRLSTICKFCN